MKKVKFSFITFLISISVIVSIGAVWLSIKSSGSLTPLTDARGQVIANSLAEKEWSEIGGIRQGYFLRSENPHNPVILYLHGGPGSPELPFIIKKERLERLEKYFTVCYWDQRGAGMTFQNSGDLSEMILSRMVEDTREMTEYLKKCFDQEKIYLMGHSWGTYLGIRTIAQYPENYLAYIGIGQVTHQLESERMAYDYMLQHAAQTGDRNAIRKLEKFDKNAADFPDNRYLMKVRTPLMNKYGIGIEHKGLSMSNLASDLLSFGGYTISDKINYLRGTMYSLKHLFRYVIEDNLFDSATRFEVPVYIFHGKYDYQVSYLLSLKYAEIIEAPRKAFYTFENSAHSPNLEEPEKFVATVLAIAIENSRQTARILE